MKTLHALAFVGLFSVLPAPPPALAAGPRAEVEGAVQDVGQVVQGEVIRHSFSIRNAGDEPLVITQVKPSCGCTVADYDRTIAPGERGGVRAEIQTATFSGPIAKSVVVFTNDPSNPRLNLVVKAVVKPVVEVRPGYARFVTVVGEGTEASVQTLRSEGEPGLEILGVDSPFSFLIAEAAAKTGEEGGPSGEWSLTLRLRKSAPAGPFSGRVEVRTNRSEQSTVRIPVSGIVRPVLAVAPERADFGRIELSEADEPYRAVLEVKNLGSGEVIVEEAAVDIDAIEAEIEEVDPGKLYRVSLTVSPEMPKGSFQGTLILTTTSAAQPELRVDLSGKVL